MRKQAWVGKWSEVEDYLEFEIFEELLLTRKKMRRCMMIRFNGGAAC